MVVRIEVSGGIDPKFVESANKELRKRLQDWRSVFKELNKAVILQTLRAIDDEGRNLDDARSWPKLTRETLRRKRKMGRTRVLQETGAMRKRVKRKTGYRMRLTRRLFVFGPKEKQDRIVQGGSAGGTVPERRIVGWSRAAQFEADRIVRQHMADVMKAWGERTRGK